MWKPGSRGGRPVVGPKVETRLPESVLAKVDAFAAQHSLSRAEALRQLVDEGLLLTEIGTPHATPGSDISNSRIGSKIRTGDIQSGPNPLIIEMEAAQRRARAQPPCPDEISEPDSRSENGTTGQKITPGAITTSPIDFNSPLYIHTLIVHALKQLGMSPWQADEYATTHQRQAVEAATEE
jgi:hypothetical protein